jgi:hypothetical protein
MGIVKSRQSADAYDNEFKLAKAAGIDAFALNMGPDVDNNQLGYAYESATRNGIKVFISFDFNDGLFSIGDPGAIGNRIKAFKDNPAQLKIDNKPFVSTFAGPGLNVAAVEAAAGGDIFFLPNWYVGNDKAGTDGFFNCKLGHFRMVPVYILRSSQLQGWDGQAMGRTAPAQLDLPTTYGATQPTSTTSAPRIVTWPQFLPGSLHITAIG